MTVEVLGVQDERSVEMSAATRQVVAPDSLDEAVALAASEDYAIVGGGTWVVPDLSYGRRDPALVITLQRTSIDRIELEDDALLVGSTSTYATVASSAAIAQVLPAMAVMARGVTGGAQIRAWGTIGGSACHASPTSDVPGLLVGVDASLRLRSSRGVREVDAKDFFLGAFETDVRTGEILEMISIPIAPAGTRVGYYKLKLCASSWPILTSTAVIAAEGSTRVTVAGLHAVPVSTVVEGRVDDADHVAIAEIAERLLGASARPWEDVLADRAYRRRTLPAIIRRSVLAAMAPVAERTSE